MRIINFSSGKKAGWGVLEGGGIELLDAQGPSALSSPKKTGEKIQLKDAKLNAPIPHPSKIVCAGFNYLEHLNDLELEKDIPKEPVLFLKPPSAVIAPEEPILYPKGVKRVDPEAELAVVMGKKYRGGKPDDAILGYTILNDVTARDFQPKGSQWFNAKGFDTFCPMGPWIETELDPKNLDIELRINGEVKQKSNTKHMLFDVFELVKRIGEFCTLYPGDIISTGTPAGVSPIKPGDLVECEIRGIGILRNPVK